MRECDVCVSAMFVRECDVCVSAVHDCDFVCVCDVCA